MAYSFQKGKSYIQQFKEAALSGALKGLDISKKSTAWIFENIKALSRPKLNESMYLKSGRISPAVIGRMIMFSYDPKLKNQLPYYDAYPLVFPVELYDDGFLGINLHYLPPMYRARLLDGLYSTINNDKMDSSTKLNISYEILKSASKFKYFKPCLKRYLYNHVRSRYYLVSIDEWNKTIFLPTQRFVGATQDKIYKDSLSKV